MGADGTAKPSGGTLTAFEPPSGPGRARGYVRLRRLHDQPELRLAAGQADRALAGGRFRRGRGASLSRARASSASRASRPISDFSRACCGIPISPRIGIYTRFVEEHIAELVAAANSTSSPALFRRRGRRGQAVAPRRAQARAGREQLAGTKIDSIDPLAVLEPRQERGQFDAVGGDRRARRETDAAAHHEITGPENTIAVARRCRERSSRSTCARANWCARASSSS